MKVLLDECLDRRLRSELAGHDVRTVGEMGWAGMANGALLAAAQSEFDVFLTLDASLPYQQNLRGFQIAVILLRAKTARLADLKPLLPRLAQALLRTRPGEVVTLAEE